MMINQKLQITKFQEVNAISAFDTKYSIDPIGVFPVFRVAQAH